MRSKLLAVGLLALVPAAALAGDGQVIVAQPGPYEIHHYWHRTNSFDHPPYFATNPPVYYGEQRMARTYGWTPYPYQGLQYREPLADMNDNVKGKSVPAKPKKDKKNERS